MAKFILLNTIYLGTSLLKAGTEIDDASENAAQIRDNGGYLAHVDNADIAAAAAVVRDAGSRGDIGGDYGRTVGMLLSAGLYGVLTAPRGADLGNADATIQWSEGRRRVLPAATVNAARAYTLGVAGSPVPRKGVRLRVTVLDATANTKAFVNGGPGAGTLLTIPVSQVGFGEFEFNGTDWELSAACTVG